MKQLRTFVLLIIIAINSAANTKDSTIYYFLPDSVKAVSFMADIWIPQPMTKKEISVGIKTDIVKLFVKIDRKGKEIVFEFPSSTQTIVTGLGIVKEKNRLIQEYNSKDSGTYKLMIATTGDSTGNFSLYSGYVFLPNEKKWKLIGTCKIIGKWNTIKQPASFEYIPKETDFLFSLNEVWCQSQNGSWKNMLQTSFTPPVVNLYSHVDSLEQIQIEKKLITQTISENETDARQEHEGIFYTILKEGTGRQVTINDTVVAFYKGYLFNDNSVFDQTKDKPATFPLNRLIKGWQIGVPLCKVGGKIKLIIPSNLAYSIRTRAAKIPPNSILVFEIEVVDAKSPQ